MAGVSGMVFYLCMTELGREQFLKFILIFVKSRVLSRIVLLIHWYAAT